MFLNSTEAALIPDLLRIDEQEQEKSHQTEPDILEPRQFPCRTIFNLCCLDKYILYNICLNCLYCGTVILQWCSFTLYNGA